MEMMAETRLKRLEELRVDQLRTIARYEALPEGCVYRRDPEAFDQFMNELRADLRMIDNGIALAKAEKGAMTDGVPASAA